MLLYPFSSLPCHTPVHLNQSSQFIYNILARRRETRRRLTDNLPSGQDSMTQWEHENIPPAGHTHYTPHQDNFSSTWQCHLTPQVTTEHTGLRLQQESQIIWLQSTKNDLKQDLNTSMQSKAYVLPIYQEKYTWAWELFHLVQIISETKECLGMLDVYCALKR